jgi:hypothetical protein
MYTDTSLPTQFVVFHYFIRGFIQYFGGIPYFVGVIGSIGAFFVYGFNKSIKAGEWERAVMIVIFGFILIGGLIGLGLDVMGGHPFNPVLS